MLIVEALRQAQEQHGYLSDEVLRDLRDRLARGGTDVPLYRLQELVTFFAHFRLEKPAYVEVSVCRDMACHLRGAARLHQPEGGGVLDQAFAGQPVRIMGVSCLGRCDRAPAVCVSRHADHGQDGSIHEAMYLGREENALVQIVADVVAGRPAPPADTDQAFTSAGLDRAHWLIDPYAEAAEKPYAGVRRLLRDFAAAGCEPTVADRLEQLRIANLLGMGGAGEPASKKWDDVRKQTQTPKYVVCNGDESEPATFKDRELLLFKPHLVVEGMILGALMVNASQGYVFIRHEYPEQVAAVRREIARARQEGVLGPDILGSGRGFELEVFVSPGGYICGEQSALIEAMEDHRAQPRNRPPEVKSNGLFNQPTLLNNVETFAWTPAVFLKGGGWYRDQGVKPYVGRRLFSVCGDVRQPGVFEVPIGSTLGELIGKAGGTLDKQPPRAVAASGPSGGFLPCRWSPEETAELVREQYEKCERARNREQKREEVQQLFDHVVQDGQLDLLRLPLDLNLFRDLGLMLGAGLMVYGEGRPLADAAVNCLEFFRNESCGKCVPCRLGSQKLVEIGTQLIQGRHSVASWESQEETTYDLVDAMKQTSICGLGTVAFHPLVNLMRFFPEEIAARLRPQDP